MSTYIGYHCKTCNETSRCNMDLCYIGDVVRFKDLVLVAKALEKAQQPLPCLFFELSCYVDGAAALLGFITQHDGHELRLYDEYGCYIDDEGEPIGEMGATA